MKIAEYETHPAADVFPLIEGEEYVALVADVKARGLLEPIWRVWVPDGNSRKALVLDGRNRLRACLDAGVRPAWRDYEGAEPMAFVWSLNSERRHLSASQLGMCSARALPLFKAEAKARQAAAGGDKRSGKTGPLPANLPEAKGDSRDKAGGSKVSGRTTQHAANVLARGTPEVVRAVDSGKLAVSAAAELVKLTPERQREVLAKAEGKDGEIRGGSVVAAVKRDERVKSITEAVGIPEGKFLVIAADPPWAYDNSGLTQSAADHYDTLPAEEIARRWKADVERVSTPRSVLFLWATSPLLPEALHVMREWGYSYKASIVWTKDRAPGIGWWVATKHELLLICTREESPQPATKIDSVIHAPVGTHSAKPEVFYDAIERMYPLGARPVHLELFSRRDRVGWVRGLYNQERAA